MWSSFVTLTVLTSHTITIVTQPSDQTVGFVETAILGVDAASSQPLTYQWYLGQSGNAYAPIANATNAHYTTPPLKSSVTYWVRVSNPAESVDSRTATISVATVPPPGFVAAYDRSRRQVLLFGGRAPQFTNQTWIMQENQYVRLHPAVSPPVRIAPVMVFDESRQQVVLFGGQKSIGGPHWDDTWAWNGTNWVELNPSTKPPARRGQGMLFDSVRQRIVLFGGGSGDLFSDTWLWDGENWEHAFPVQSPPASIYHGMVFQTHLSKGVVFGLGHPSVPASLRASTWTWDGSSWLMEKTSNNPAERYIPAMAYDAAHQQTVVFGGQKPGGGYYDDTWLWDGTNWTQAFPKRNPPARHGSTMVYDLHKGHLVLFGGSNDTTQFNDTWLWDGSDWTPWPLGTRESPALSITFDGRTNPSGNSQVLGWLFTVNQELSVTGLGLFDDGLNGLGEAHLVLIWEMPDTIVAMATVTEGHRVQLVDNFRYVPLVNTTVLTPGKNYVIGAIYQKGSLDFVPESVTEPRIQANSAINYMGGRYGLGSGRVLPNAPVVPVSAGYFGPNFLFSSSAWLNILTQPENTEVSSGQTATLTVSVSGGAPFRYQWYLGQSGDTRSPIAGATSNSYTTPPLTATTMFWVRVSNTAGSADSLTSVVTLRDSEGPLWEFTIQGGINTPGLTIGSDGTVYVGSDDFSVYALDGKSGAQRWKFTTEGIVMSSVAVGEDGTVYFGSGDKKVYAVESSSGMKRWEFVTGGMVRGSPSIGSDGTVYVGSEDKKVYALDGVNGTKKWEFLTGGRVLSCPAIAADGTVYVGSLDGKVYALNGATGAMVWDFQTDYEISSAPAIGPNNTVYICSHDAKVYALDAISGAKLWEFLTDSSLVQFRTSPAIGLDGTVYVGTISSMVYAINGMTGVKQWEYENIGTFNSPVIGADGVVYVGDGKLFELDGKTGRKKREFQAVTSTYSAPALGKDGTIYIADYSGKIRAFPGSVPNGDAVWPMFGQNQRHTCRSVVPATAVPVITSQPASQTIGAGSTATLSIIATGAEPLAFQWYLGQSGDTNAPITGATNVSYTTPSLNASASYWIRVSSLGGFVDSQTATVDIQTTALVMKGQWPGYRQGPAKDVAISGQHAYVAAAGLHVIDISNPANPQRVGGFSDTMGAVNGVAISGHYAYLADGFEGLLILDVGNPANPHRVGAYDILGQTFDVAIQGNYAYVVGPVGLQILDINDPTFVFRVGEFDTGNSATSVAVSKDYAYVVCDAFPASEHSGLLVVDIREPNASRLAGSLEMPNLFKPSLALAGDNIYVTDGILWVIDVSDPAHSRLIGSHGSTYAQEVAVAGEYAYVANGADGFLIVDISNAGLPGPIATANTTGEATAVAISGGVACVADSWSGLHVFDVSHSSQPALLGTIDPIGDARGVAMAGDYVYLADGDFQVIDVTDPTKPRKTAGMELPGYAGVVAVSGSHVYVSEDRFGIHIIDISNPILPTEVAQVAGAAKDIYIMGNYAFAVEAELRVLDVSDPVRPNVIGRLALGRSADGVVTDGNYAYIAAGPEGLKVIDIKDRTNPKKVADLDTSGDARAVAVSGHYAFITDYEAGVQIIDISDPVNPKRVGGLDTGGRARDIVIEGHFAYVANDGPGVIVLDITHPTNPRNAGQYRPPGLAFGIAGQSGRVSVASGDWGLAILEFQSYVPEAPLITSQPQSQNAAFGSTAAFVITATGPEPLGYEWKKDGTVLTDGGRISGATTPILRITAIQAGDIGQYHCIVSNVAGSVASQTVELRLLPTLVVTSEHPFNIEGAFEFLFVAEPGVQFRVQYSSDLRNWIDLKSVESTGDPIRIIDPEAKRQYTRFYRAIGP